jgi:hypothetical protein
MASRDPTDDKCISLALNWLSRLHERRVNNRTGEHVSASEVGMDEFRKRLERPMGRDARQSNDRERGGTRNAGFFRPE